MKKTNLTGKKPKEEKAIRILTDRNNSGSPIIQLQFKNGVEISNSAGMAFTEIVAFTASLEPPLIWLELGLSETTSKRILDIDIQLDKKQATEFAKKLMELAERMKY